MFKRFMVVLSALLMVTSSFNVFATEIEREKNLESSFVSYKQFEELKSQGVVGEDVTYEYLKKINEEAKKLEEALENSEGFTKSELTSSFNMAAGDILITNSTSSAGLTGHAAIAISSTEILNIAGLGETIKILTKSEFIEEYNKGWIKVYRINNDDIAKKAAKWASTTYKGKKPVYRLTMDLTTTHETYCSKIVFQSYYFGGNKNIVSNKFSLYGILGPYAIPSAFSEGSYRCTNVGSL